MDDLAATSAAPVARRRRPDSDRPTDHAILPASLIVDQSQPTMPARNSPPVHSSKPQPSSRPHERAPAAAETTRDGLQRARAQPATAPPQAILSLQHRFGNRAVQRLIQPKSKNLDLSTLRASAQTATQTSRMLQLKRARVSSKTTSRNFTGQLKNKPAEDAKAVEKAGKGAAFAQFDNIDISEALAEQVRETAAGPVAWYKLSSGKGAGQFIRW